MNYVITATSGNFMFIAALYGIAALIAAAVNIWVRVKFKEWVAPAILLMTILSAGSVICWVMALIKGLFE